MAPFDWDDLRIFLAAARAGSLTAAAARLGIDPATVGRRVARLETSLKSTLLIRSAAGLELTASGARLQDVALEAEAAMEAASKMGTLDAVSGTVRLSVAEGFGGTIIAPALPALHARYKGLRIELAENAGFLSPARREVDVAVTLSAPLETRLVVEPLAEYELGLYASREYIENYGLPEAASSLSEFDLVGYVDDLIYAPQLKYLDEICSGLRPALTSSSIRAQREIILASGGIGVLPRFMSGGLIRVLPSEVTLTRQFWISTHKDAAGTARVRAVHRWIVGLIAANLSLMKTESD